ncbi:hypothetical protein E4T39_02624 [Aureobasidium subglaciale]|nr:hypothetical protein E4T39_02624 [Aureobasidium subglaciale]
MEASGLMNRFPCLVVRGICNYSDSHKNTRWQGYAAMTAAAYAKDVMTRMVPIQVEATIRLGSTLDSMSQKLDVLLKTTQTIDQRLGVLQEQNQNSQVKSCLTSSDPSANYNKVSNLRREGNGLWFIHSDAFKQLQKQSNSLSWLYGIPDCGKTVLNSIFIEHLKQQVAGQVLAYFFFDSHDSCKQSLDDAIHPLITQLSQMVPNSRQHLVQLWKSHDGRFRQRSNGSLRIVSQEMLREAALDESILKAEVLTWLESLVESKTAACRLLVTSCEQADIGEMLQDCTSPADWIAVQRSAANEHNHAYVKDNIS